MAILFSETAMGYAVPLLYTGIQLFGVYAEPYVGCLWLGPRGWLLLLQWQVVVVWLQQVRPGKGNDSGAQGDPCSSALSLPGRRMTPGPRVGPCSSTPCPALDAPALHPAPPGVSPLSSLSIATFVHFPPNNFT